MIGTKLPNPEPGLELPWVERHLAHLARGPVHVSPINGGQGAADRAARDFDVRGYARTRNEVWPAQRRGASGLSPYIRHGLITLPRAWNLVAGGPGEDVAKFRDELLWQEYARHLYARAGVATGSSLRSAVPERGPATNPQVSGLACVDHAWSELRQTGWITNQQRMWLASHWTVREGAGWRDGEDEFFRNLLDGSRAANRLGWQWTTGAGSGRPYGFSRNQVERRAPGLCRTCRLSAECPIQEWPADAAAPAQVTSPARLRTDDDLGVTRGPVAVLETRTPEVVWLTAESMGDDDPALAANPGLPVVFVFDEALLDRLGLSAMRLVFLAQCLADLASRRHVEVWLGDPALVLAERHLSATFAPVPGWRRLASSLHLAQTHPWPWLRQPGRGSLRSFSAWRNAR